MILKISEALQVPLRDRNDWLLAAGFAPLFQARSLDDPQMAQVMAAVRMILNNHAPYPAVAIDRAWNLRLANAPFERLATFLNAGPEPNLLRLFFHPQGVGRYVANWSAVAPLLWVRARREAAASLGTDIRQILDELTPHLDESVLAASGVDDAAPLLPVLPIVLARDGVELSLFSVISSFGTAQDVTADELRLETFFPADQVTRDFFEGS